ncbi:hypothetical protein B1757_13605 [Acidithiobacillus marinus]|uniref:Thioredoxin-like fold domain-containing protein n=1 Tax=Acidithiobacillus marinus TaxID=187490 RepID=A0A2I1DIE0_9PROT|nr:thioredoxin fold domain-containing protein [Acidithiobacillus marinus]PKY09635.1 hypothetical protein B1757_13605 [Acidithiobacillus marinus]
MKQKKIYGLAATLMVAIGIPVLGYAAVNDLQASNATTLKPGTSAQEAEAQKLVNQLTHDNVTVLKTYQTPSGMIAVEGEGKNLDPKGKHPRTLVWMTPDGKALIPVPAPLISANRVNYTEKALIAMGIMRKPEPASKVAQQIAHQARTFTIGKSGPVIDAFLDPNCIFCHKFYEHAIPAIDKGKLRMRVTLVGFLKPSSAPKATAILASKDPAKAMAYNERHFNVPEEEGGIHPLNKSDPRITATVGANTAILTHTGETATPTILFCKKDGGLAMIHGAPRNLDGFIRHLSQSRYTINPDGNCSPTK